MRFDPTPFWYKQKLNFLTILLLPFSWIFRAIIIFRKFLYQKNIFKTTQFPVPIIIVGNITVGGTGKTPLVIWLTEYLISLGYKPGIVSRGAGGKSQHKPILVNENSSSIEVGDEALLLKQRTHCPLVICTNRVLAVETLLNNIECNIVISDDGLQHYALHRDIEIAVIDGVRQLGNQQLLPAGPLREPPDRLKSVDFVIENGISKTQPFYMTLNPMELISMETQTSKSLADFKTKTVHAVAGIGHPERFFNELKKAGINIIEHAFPDHYRYQEKDFKFKEALPIVMTEKDAVKCAAFKNINQNFYYLRVIAAPNTLFQQKLLLKLNTLNRLNHSENTLNAKINSEEDFSGRTCERVTSAQCKLDGRHHDNHPKHNS